MAGLLSVNGQMRLQKTGEVDWQDFEVTSSEVEAAMLPGRYLMDPERRDSLNSHLSNGAVSSVPGFDAFGFAEDLVSDALDDWLRPGMARSDRPPSMGQVPREHTDVRSDRC